MSAKLELRVVFALTGVASTAAFRSMGINQSGRESLMRQNRMFRIRKGWFKVAEANQLVVGAVQERCVLSGSHALINYGGWVPHGSPLRYLSFDGRAKVVAAGAQLHHRPKTRAADCSYGVAPWKVALHHAFVELELPERVAIIDSLFNSSSLHRISHHELRTTLLEMGCAKELALVDRGAESGVETVARVRLVLHGHKVRTQVRLQNGMRIDLVVDEKLAIEIDGSSHGEHQQFRRDIRKGQLTAAAGYQTLRLSYWDVVNSWDESYALIVSCLARA